MGKLRPGKLERIAIRQKKALAKPSRVSENATPTRQVWIGTRAVCRYDVPSLTSCLHPTRIAKNHGTSKSRSPHNRLEAKTAKRDQVRRDRQARMVVINAKLREAREAAKKKD